MKLKDKTMRVGAASNQSLLRRLEPRIVFDGAALVTALDAGPAETGEDQTAAAAVTADARGKFYAYGDTAAPAPAVIQSIAAAATDSLRDRALASIHGGPIPVRAGPDNAVIPEGGIYEARFHIEKLTPVTPQAISREVTGVMRIEARSESIARRLWRQINTVLVRESGF